MSTVCKRSVAIRGHRTSFSVEQPFFTELERIAGERQLTLAALVASVDEMRAEDSNLSSALRVFVLQEVRRAATPG